MTVSDPGAGQQQADEVPALVCPFCGSKLWVDTATKGSGYMSYEVPDAIACDGDCDVEWNTDGTVRTAPRWVRHPDLFTRPAAPSAQPDPGAGQHCPSCICGRRAPVQMTRDRAATTTKPARRGRGEGTIAWAEHLEAYADYSGRYGNSQSAERLAERGGFGYWELADHLGHEPTTWVPR